MAYMIESCEALCRSGSVPNNHVGVSCTHERDQKFIELIQPGDSYGNSSANSSGQAQVNTLLLVSLQTQTWLINLPYVVNHKIIQWIIDKAQ